MRIIFRADGDATIGLGHVVRSLALAEIVRSVAECGFAIQNPSAAIRELLSQQQVWLWELPVQPIAAEAPALAARLQPTDIVVLDGYTFDTDYQRALRRSGCRLVAIDDLRAWPSQAHLLINHSPGVTPAMYQTEPDTRFCLGPEYSLLRPPFLANFHLPEAPTAVQSVLLCFGGADPQQLTARFLAALLPLGGIREIGVITGSAFPHTTVLEELASRFPSTAVTFYQNATALEMVRLLQRHDAVVCPASTILIESLFLGKPVVTGYYVENQRHLANYVQEHQQARSLGDFTAIAPDDLQPALVRALTELAQMPRQPYVLQPRPEHLRAEFRRLQQPAAGALA